MKRGSLWLQVFLLFSSFLIFFSIRRESIIGDDGQNNIDVRIRIKRQKTKIDGEEFEKFGVLAGVNNFYGMLTGRKFDFEKAIQAHQEGKILSEIMDEITFEVEEEPFDGF